MSTRRTLTLSAVAALTLTLGASTPTTHRAARVDTIANVAIAAKAGGESIAPVQLALGDANTVMKRMATDSSFQKTVLQFAAKNDLAGLTSTIQKLAPSSTVKVTKVADFFITVEFTIKGHTVTVCASSKQACNNTNAFVLVS
jgi:hypothetical protein